MTDPVQPLALFQTAIDQRCAEEQRSQQLSGGPGPEEQQLTAALERMASQRQVEWEGIEEQYQTVTSQCYMHYDEQLSAISTEHQLIIKQIESTATRSRQELERQREDSAWVMSSVLDENADDSPVRQFEKYKTQLLKAKDEQKSLLTELEANLQKFREQRGWKPGEVLPLETLPPQREAAGDEFMQLAEQGRKVHKSLQSAVLPRLFVGFNSLILFAVLSALFAIPLGLFVDPAALNLGGGLTQNWMMAAVGIGAVASLLLTVILWTLASMHQGDLYRQLQQNFADASGLHQHWSRLTKEELDREGTNAARERKRMVRDREQTLERYEANLAERVGQIESQKVEQLEQENLQYSSARSEIEANRALHLSQIEQEHDRQVQEHTQRWEQEMSAQQAQLSHLAELRQTAYREHREAMTAQWESAVERFATSCLARQSRSRELFPDWPNEAMQSWQPPDHIPPFIRLGEIPLELHQWQDALSEDPQLQPQNTSLPLPLDHRFPEELSLLLKSPNGQAREEAVALFQTIMLRLLLSVPPGKLRFTLIDPIGLGESFGGFMHLADYDELMVTHRIWTESSQIESRLADLTEHMENVLQKYLRNEFQTIEEYNASAGEVAEPYHILVTSDFPAKFTDIAARRLTSIINSGPRCGVYTLLNLDPTKHLPNQFALKDIVDKMQQFEWRDGAFHSTRPHLEQWPLKIDRPPASELFTTIVKTVGDASKDARRVEVAFSRIAPPAKELWSRDSRRELEVPLGRAGATKLQTMRLGKGTSQHMLVAGKTGSGKSTFLHIIITNLALYYGPDEVNFYLIDFKKGVEFKDYATLNLPHAKVIAIESDREFGVSTLQRLDEVLQQRGELFRRHGVQDIAGYRNANPQAVMPRILLIVDEFQEFFIEDDKLSQNATLLLDRLVRQGRAFGIHVILGSQTLGGAYSLARSTLGQVAVRVALQCSEADAHLILSEDNSAARLLTRPGEAIYNDANGMLEGNSPFQIAWLSDDVREQYLKQLQELIIRRGLSVDSAVVFEGNIPSDITRNHALRELAAQFSTRDTPIAAPTVWLGDAVEIKPPTEITFHRQNGNHLLIVGQDAEAAFGMLSAAYLALAAGQVPSPPTVDEVTHAESDLDEPAIGDTATPDDQSEGELADSQPSSPVPELFLFDGSPDDAAEHAAWNTLTSTLPVRQRLSTPRDAETAIREIHAELKRREENSEEKHSPLFVFVYHLAKFRDLKKAEDDFGSFGTSMADKPMEPGKAFAEILTQGPAVGIHALIWCDSYNNVERWFSRQTLRELEQRVALQMNASDSSNLVDSPAASRLGTHRALLYREETGTSEKLRPYGPFCGMETSAGKSQSELSTKFAWLEMLRNLMLHGEEAEIATDLEEFSIL